MLAYSVRNDGGNPMIGASRLRKFALRAMLVALLVGAVAGATVAAAGERKMEVAFEHDGDPVYRVLPPGKIPAIEDPEFVRDEAAGAQMAPEEPVFGIESDGEARAYSLWQLDHHEIVNDRIGGTAIAATW